MRNYCLCCVVLLLCGGVKAGGGDLTMVGEARLSFLFWPVYDSRLYSVDGNYREGQFPLRFEIRYLRDIDAADLVKQTRTEWQHLGPLRTKEQQWLESLAHIWPDVRQNDVLALLVDERGESAFSFNGQPIGRIRDPEFGRHFLAIWLSPDTSRPGLRAALLGDD